MAKLAIAVTKGKGTVEIDTDALPEEVFKEALIQGLKVLVNRGMSKITKVTYPVEAELHAAAMAKAEENVTAIGEGKIKFSGATKATKASGAVMTEARRLARNLVKDEMKKAKIKISHVEAKEITKAANALLATEDIGKQLMEQAQANLDERAKTPVAASIISAIPISDKLAAKDAARKAKDQLSAKQAGKPKVRAKGQAQATAQA